MERPFEGYFVGRPAEKVAEPLVPTEALEPEEELFYVAMKFYWVLSQPLMEIPEAYLLVPW